MQLLDLRHWTTVTKLIQELDLPAIEDAVSHGTPCLKVKKKFLCRIKEDGETLVIHTDDRDIWLAEAPEVFFFTDHYRNYPYVLANLKKIGKRRLRALLIQSWKEIAPKKALAEWEERQKK